MCVAVILRIRGDRPSWPSTHVGQSDRGFAKMTFPWKVAGWPLAGRRKRAWNRRTGMHSRMGQRPHRAAASNVAALRITGTTIAHVDGDACAWVEAADPHCPALGRAALFPSRVR
ncbi:hypothetical protein BOC38_20335 [Burkholderia pseudomallei]|nr:hypothetical protein BOC38_20335 [Burkholderia pseudomallei]